MIDLHSIWWILPVAALMIGGAGAWAIHEWRFSKFRHVRQQRQFHAAMRSAMKEILEEMLEEAMRCRDKSMINAVREVARGYGLDLPQGGGLDLDAAGVEPAPEGGYRVKREDDQ